MRLLWSDENFLYAGRPKKGFPVLLDDNSEVIQPFQDFLLYQLLERGRLYSTLTWDAYGRHIWDYVSFLAANGIRWDEPFVAPGFSPMARYRDWSCFELDHEPTTVTGRLRTIRTFYEWAKEQGLIARLPFAYEATRAYTYRSSRSSKSITLNPRTWDKDAEFLVLNQISALRRLNLSESQRILIQLLLRVGLRSCEARTFPKKYVFDPRACANGRDSMIAVRLDPRDMSIKYGKSRVVDIPTSLMQEMHRYTVFERNRLCRGEESIGSLLVTEAGCPYSKSGVVGEFKKLSKLVGYRVTALMLRHSYAVHTLRRLHADRGAVGDPLLYVRDRLGHESVNTTVRYLRQIERLAGSISLAADDEISLIFGT